MRSSVSFAITLCSIFVLGGRPMSIAYALDLQEKIDPLAKPLIDEGEAVSFVIGVVRNGEKQIIGYGEVEKGSGKAPTGETVYEIGSVTKAITCVILADMIHRGEVKLDDPLQKILPADVKVAVADGKPITLEHVATHTSGLPRLPNNMGFFGIWNPWNPYASYTPKKMYAFLNGHKLRRPPGEYEYSNYAMGLLGHELARFKGMSYEELFIDRIGKPLGMNDTRVTLDEGLKKRLAPPYSSSLTPQSNWDIPTLAGAGGLRSTTDDMLTFLEANLANRDQPLTASLKLSHEKRHEMEDGLAMGLGWHIARDGVTRWHNGMTGGYASWIAFVPEHNAAAVVLSNVASGKITTLGEQITRVACGIEVEPPKKRTAVAVDADTLKSYEGVYAITPQFALTVSVEGGKLMVQATNQQKFQVFAESPTEFFYKVVDAQLTFEPGEDGKARRVILHQNGRDMPGERR
jgi:CubicO group peptidase (beta-lactamase class C family)